jgi:GNAT superfamily N-acetyltransferase
MKVTLSEANEQDVSLLYELTLALARFERKTPDQILVTEEKLRKCGFGPNRVFRALIARVDDKPVGMCVFYYGYSGYAGAATLYVEDLFVLHDFRGHGIGSEMLRRLAELAVESDCYRMEGLVFDWNKDAIACYKLLGANLRTDLINVRLEEDKLREFVQVNSKRDKDTAVT